MRCGWLVVAGILMGTPVSAQQAEPSPSDAAAAVSMDRIRKGLAEPDHSEERILVRGDLDELRAAVLNLLDNAIKYSDKALDIRVEMVPTDSRRVMIRVSDRGVGIPPKEIRHVFKRFYRVPRRVLARVKGTGLGLFIVRSVVEKHGGKVFAESPGEGLGSTFTIQLPRANPT